MNREDKLVSTALDNLQKTTGITATWTANPGTDIDGKLDLKLPHERVKLYVEVRRELRSHNLPQIEGLAKRYSPLIVIAQQIFPKIKEQLREKGISYMETNGNIFLKEAYGLVWVESQKPLPVTKNKMNRAFTKTGLRVLFHFLLNEEFLNLPYRQVAQITGVALGNINYVITGLKEENYLLKVNRDQYKLQNKKELLDKWAVAYEQRLKPALEIGTFRFINPDDYSNWKHLPINSLKTHWGGEPGGDMLTNYLKPAELTLYTEETKKDLIKNYRLIPDPGGTIRVYQKFWQDNMQKSNFVAPPILIYADLLNTGDKRCIETAVKVYEKYLRNQF